jgi:HK97 family phage portal protein
MAMSVLDRIRGLFRAQSPEDPRTNLSQWYSEITGTGADMANLPLINEQTSRTVSALYRGVALLSGIIAALPLNVVYRPANGISRLAPEHRLASLLSFAPNPAESMTAYSWKALIMQSRIYGGNFFSRILYDGAARIIGLRYYPYTQVRVIYDYSPPYTRHYVFTELDGTVSDPIPDDEVVHILSEVHNGRIGESLIFGAAKSTLQMQLFLQTQTQNVHNNAIKAGGVVKLPAGITVDQKKRYEQFFKLAYQGSANVGNLLWLDAGADFTQLTPSLSLVDLQTIEFLRYGVNDIGRFLGIPSHLLNEQSQTSSFGTGLEQISRSFLLYTLEPHLVAIETELRFKMFGNSDYYPQFDRSLLLATDAKSQAEIETLRVNSGISTINEIRKGDNLPPVKGGDESIVNGTMQPLSQALEPPAPPPTAPEPPANPPASRARRKAL